MASQTPIASSSSSSSSVADSVLPPLPPGVIKPARSVTRCLLPELEKAAAPARPSKRTKRPSVKPDPDAEHPVDGDSSSDEDPVPRRSFKHFRPAGEAPLAPLPPEPSFFCSEEELQKYIDDFNLYHSTVLLRATYLNMFKE